MKQKVLLLISSVFLINGLSKAQSNFSEGYIITNNKLTVRGYIDYREWDNSPKSIEFKKNLEDKDTEIYRADRISEFAIGNVERYVSYIGLISNDSQVEFSNLSHDADTSKRLDTIFLRQIRTGKNISLFTHSDRYRRRAFVSEGNSTPVELIYHRYLQEFNKIFESPIFKGQLAAIAEKYKPEDPSLKAQIRQLKFADFWSNGKVDNIIDEINDYTEEKKSSNHSASFFIGLSINRYQHSLNGDQYFVGTRSLETAPAFLIGLDLYLNPEIRKSVFRTELGFSSLKAKIPAGKIVHYNNNRLYYDLEQYIFSLTPQYIFNIHNSDKIKYFVGAGISLNYSGYPTNKIVFDSSVNGSMSYPLKNFWVNIPLQTGFNFSKRFDLLFRYYLTGNLIQANTPYSLKISTTTFGANFHF